MGRGFASFWILSLTREGTSPTVFWLSIDQQYVQANIKGIYENAFACMYQKLDPNCLKLSHI